MVNDHWFGLFPNSLHNVLPEGISDHSALIIQFDTNDRKRRKTFCYFNMWAHNQNFLGIVKENWSKPFSASRMYIVVQKLKVVVKHGLLRLNKERFYDIEK